jgi:hypothetical protein
MVHRLRRSTLTLVFVGIGYAVLYRRNKRSPRPAGGGWVDLSFDA